MHIRTGASWRQYSMSSINFYEWSSFWTAKHTSRNTKYKKQHPFYKMSSSLCFLLKTLESNRLVFWRTSFQWRILFPCEEWSRDLDFEKVSPGRSTLMCHKVPSAALSTKAKQEMKAEVKHDVSWMFLLRTGFFENSSAHKKKLLCMHEGKPLSVIRN